MFHEIAIIGPGLLGGSIALALQGKANVRVWGRRPAVVEEIARSGIVPIASTRLEAVVAGADLIIFCTPVEVMAGLAREILPHLRPGAVITDVGSVKEKVLREVAPIFVGNGSFIGSHPMAGSEQAGWEAARADLFAGAVCILTPEEGRDVEKVARLAEFWTELGCQVCEMSATEHDQRVGSISHLPHLASACLMSAVEAEAREFSGQGLRDSTRIAAGPPAMWSGILLANRANVRSGLQSLIARLQEADALLETEDEAGLRKFLTAAKSLRDALPEKKHHGGI